MEAVAGVVFVSTFAFLYNGVMELSVILNFLTYLLTFIVGVSIGWGFRLYVEKKASAKKVR